MTRELREFYNFLFEDGEIHCVSSKEPWGFSRNIFIKNFEELERWTNQNKDKDSYINYNPLKTTKNRKNDNIKGVKVIALDIEFEDKQRPETEERIWMLRSLVEDSIIKKYRIKQYIIVESGNGLHVYLPIGKLIQKEFSLLKPACNKFVDEIHANANKYLLQIHNIQISMDDRKDLAGILRLPGTFNTKANRRVTISKIVNTGENEYLRKKFFSCSRRTTVQLKKAKIFREKFKGKYSNIETPKTIDELESHPVVQMLFDYDLPEVTGWHQSVIFALQALVKFSDIPYYPDIKQLEDDINQAWGMSVSLQHCTAEDVRGPLFAAYNFTKLHNFEKYKKAIENILFSKS